jgi:RNA polymerase sigma-70 factor (ECF subfamily)
MTAEHDYAHEPDRALLAGWRGGDARAGNALFQRYFQRLYRFFHTKVPGGAVEDLIQQTLIACVEGHGRLRDEGSFGGYLFGAARFTLFAFLRGRQRHDHRLDPLESSLAALEPSPSVVALRNAEERLLADCLRRIPLDLQIALELHYWEDMTSAELGAALGIPAGTVRSRLRRAKEALRAVMAERAAAGTDVEATLGDLARWARSLRDQVGRP